jgi:citrate/tricarballylate utilization protein
MPDSDVMRHGEHVLTVCNACRYCEQYCPMFPAMERRLVFSQGDLAYLANLCHNCGECLYACQYAPPHPFGINVPRTLAEIRVQSYEDAAWPPSAGAMFRRHNTPTMLALVLGMSVVISAITWWEGGAAWPVASGGDFYAVLPHHVLLTMFGGVSALAAAALAGGVVRFWRQIDGPRAGVFRWQAVMRALKDAFTLRHLHGGGVDCTSAEESRSPWRRRWHHCTAYGFLLCFASTTVAAIYHLVFGWRAPYAFTSLPVVLGTVGGIGLIAGPAGLLALRRTRDEALGDPAQQGLDTSFIALLFLTGLTGLLLLVLRERTAMAVLLTVHLGSVTALFLTIPYGKFVHGIYRTVALVKDALEASAGHP